MVKSSGASQAVIETFLSEGGALTAGMAVMKGTAQTQVKAPTGAGVRPIGVVNVAVAAAGLPVPIVTWGPAVGVGGGAIAIGDALKIEGTTGKLVATTTANDEIIGRARETGADATEFGIFVCPSLY